VFGGSGLPLGSPFLCCGDVFELDFLAAVQACPRALDLLEKSRIVFELRRSVPVHALPVHALPVHALPVHALRHRSSVPVRASQQLAARADPL
jgi:hypothetical protein